MSNVASGGEPLVVVVRAGSVERPLEVRSGLELARSLPLGSEDDSGAFSVFVEGPAGWLPTSVGVWSLDPAGEPLDQVGPVPLELTACPPGAGKAAACAVTGSLHLVPTDVERGHPRWRDAAVVGRVGGQIVVDAGGNPVAWPIVGPRALGGEVLVSRARIRIVRLGPSGQPALDPNEERALELARAGLAEASALWGQCGFRLAVHGADDVRVVEPPRVDVVEIGCEGGLPASGGQVRLATRAGVIRLTTRPGESAGSVAGRLAVELDRRGLRAKVAENPPSESSAGPSYDVIVPRAPGAGLGPQAGGPLSTDPTLGVCLGELTLEDGLSHFEDENAKSATLEERALLRGVVDSNPETIDVAIVPYFAGRGRIGESFIGGGGASLQNLVVLDRAGLRASARSSTWAHELGHVFLAQPGHSDDFGLDRPDRLMDADASDATAFGPRRLSLEECQRAIAQHGPESAAPLLEAVPAGPPAPRR